MFGGGQMPSWMGTYGSPTSSSSTGSATTSTSPPPPPVAPPETPAASGGGFQLAGQTGQTGVGLPSWYNDFVSSGSGDLNQWYQKNQGYADMSLKPEAQQLSFAPPPPPPAAAAAPAAAPAAPQQPKGNYWDPRYGPEPVLNAQQKLQTEIPGTLHYNASPDPQVMNWMRWNLGEQGFQDYMRQRSSQRQTWADQAANRGAPGDRLDR